MQGVKGGEKERRTETDFSLNNEIQHKYILFFSLRFHTISGLQSELENVWEFITRGILDRQVQGRDPEVTWL